MNWKSMTAGVAIVLAVISMPTIGPEVDAMREANVQALADEVALSADKLPRAFEQDIWIHNEAQRLINGANFSEVFPDMIAETSYSVDYDNCAAVIELLVNIINNQKVLISEMKNTENKHMTKHIKHNASIDGQYSALIIDE